MKITYRMYPQNVKMRYIERCFLLVNGEVVFEFPSIRSLSACSQAKFMVGMDK
jgi:hypothetical protein